ncbi:S8 family serine peptidase [Thiomicrorhabdus sp. ZW0627]|uniref:S8 family serine peptidase n=1 Tax=Thiomicrorhabdus sp. ZW0627 TaxID=3039774 RepID=UPI0024374612|nr:S8 family serine peptidase [Thiomicrorhabdus sp. ZW0627]MDG6773654.1 S8 family serine peptidase [Thiomicrorhabdus sp. ZW0627]
MKIRRGYVSTLFLTGLLAGCGGGGGSDTPVAPAPVPVPDELISAINDPFVQHQWYLYNYGQAALSTSNTGGTVNDEGTYADIRVFDGSVDSAAAYAKGYTGDGIQVAIIDNGVDIAHEDLAANVLLGASYNFYSSSNTKDLHDPTPPATVANPSGYHGVSVAGLAMARGGNELGIWGVAPQAELVGYNLLYSSFDLNMELAAIGYSSAVSAYPELYSDQSIDVFNMSYGRNPYQGTNENASYDTAMIDGYEWGTQNLRGGKGAVYLKAAGNEYAGGTVFTSSWCKQANDNGLTCYNVNMENQNVNPFLMVIGGFNADDKRSSYANTGSALWMVGPAGEYGVDHPALVTTDMSGCTYGFSQNQSTADILGYLPYTSDFNTGVNGTGNEQCNYFSAFNGTSSSTPVMSGIAALMLQANPNLTWRDVKYILATTARKLDPNLAAKTLLLGGQLVTLEQGWVSNAAVNPHTGNHYLYSNAYGFGAPDTNAAIQMALDWKTNGTTMAALQTTADIVGPVPTANQIPDNSAVGLVPAPYVNVADNLVVESVELTLSIKDVGDVLSEGTADNKIDMSDYQVVLRSPSGTESILLTPFNAYKAGYDMNSLKLISHAFYGESSAGDWTLIVRDLDGDAILSDKNIIADSGTGKLTGWSLKFYGH